MKSFHFYKEIPSEERTKYTVGGLVGGLLMMLVAGGIIYLAISAAL